MVYIAHKKREPSSLFCFANNLAAGLKQIQQNAAVVHKEWRKHQT